MEDEEILQCQLELMHALQTRQPLRRVQLEERPPYIGGFKPTSQAHLSDLQAEFLQSSVAMQMRVRPKLESMHAIRRHVRDQDTWRKVHKDIREALQEGNGSKREDYKGPLLLFQIQQLLEGRPGWKSLLQEVKEPRHSLQPIDFDGFHIVKGYDSQTLASQ